MADAKLLRGELFLEEDNPSQAQECFKAALALDPQAAGTESAIAEWNRFCASTRKPDVATFVPAPVSVIAPEPVSEASPALDLLAQADEAIGRQDFEAGQELLIAALDLDPNLPLIYRALSGLLDSQGDSEMARKILEAGLDQNPEDESLWDSLIDLAEALDPAQAGPDAKDALSRVPTGGGGRWHQLAAQTLLEQGQRDAALRVLEEGLRHYPRHVALRAVREAQYPALFKPPSPSVPDRAPRMTVICAVWHRDPDRFALLRDHQACLDAQTVPVDRIYVFDGGDQPPEWIHGKVVATREKLTIYEAWNLALPLVRTPYLMTLNLDDRLNLDCVALYEEALDAGADLTTGDWRITFSQEETNRLELSFPAKDLPLVRGRMWPPPPHEPARLGSAGENWSLGPAYAWRMNLHLEFPRFPWMFGDRSLIRTIGDAVWGKLLEGAGKKIVRLPKVVGHYYSHPGEQAEFRNPANAETETINRVGIAYV
jgi:tetratricopeptide (TPR) repeat protein